jgi:SPP1 family predicted phage head-tail adaptor
MAYTVNPGDMRTQITLQSPTISQDAGGAQVNTYANVSPNPTVWARWVNAHGVEAVTSEALKTVQRATVTIRHRTDINTTWRVLKSSEAWQIISIDPVQDKRRFVELVVERAKGSA